MRKTTIILAIGAILCLPAKAKDQQSKSGSCVLSAAKDGQLLELHGKVVHGARDLLLEVPGCEERIALIYTVEECDSRKEPCLKEGGAVSESGMVTVKKDREFKRFQKYLEVRYKSTRNDICLECYKYEVEATFQGRIGVTDNVDSTLDKDSRHIVAPEGFGHPEPFLRYRLVLHSVSEVTWKKLPPLRSSHDRTTKSKCGLLAGSYFRSVWVQMHR